MIDRELRRVLAPTLDGMARRLSRLGARPMHATAGGLILAVGAATAAARGAWIVALCLWLVSRLADGIDGPLARVTGTDGPLGGWADISADFAAYGVFVVGCGIGNPDARVACLVLLLTYYVNGGTLLALAAAAAVRGVPKQDERTLLFTRSLAEGTETIVVHSVMVLFPVWMSAVAWTFALVVLATIGQRTVVAFRMLR